MNKHRIFYVFAMVIGLALGSAVAAQEAPNTSVKKIEGQKEKQTRVRRPNLFRELDLSTEQIAQIRRIYATGRPVMKIAQARLREAGRALDRAIYADVLDEGVVPMLLEEQKAAQAEVLRLKYLGELEVRKVLTPTQLTKFRELRGRFEKHRKTKIRTVHEKKSERKH